MAALAKIAIALAIVLLLRFICVSIYRLWISPLKVIPGPRLQALTSIPHDLACIRGIRHLHLERLHDLYGPIVRVSPTEISFIDSSVWRDVYGFRKNDAECMKSDVLEHPNGYTGILDANRMDHRRYRRLLSHAFSEHSLRQQEHRLQQHTDLLVDGLRSQSRSGPIDMTNWLQWTTFDIMGDLAFGESFRSLETKKTHPWQQFLVDNIAASVFIGVAQRWGLDKFIMLLTPPSLLKAVQEFHDLTSQRIDKRVALGKDRGDFLDHVLKHDLITDETKDRTEVKGMRLEELKSTASDIAIAGSETTATLLAGLFYFLLTNPHTLVKLTTEIRTLGSGDKINVASTSELPYLSATLDEALRLFIPSPIIAARSIPSGGLAVGGYFLPGGTRVFSSHHVAYRSELHFARPKEFIPERWLPDRADEFKNDNARGIYHPFAYGPRNCIGSNLARAEMRLIVSKLLLNFDFSRPKSSIEDPQYWASWMDRLKLFFLWHKPPLMVDVATSG